MRSPRAVAVAAAVVLSLGTGLSALATHSWGGYHWARTSNPFTLQLGDNLTSAWDPYLDTSIADWSISSVLDLTKVAGSTAPKTCKPKAGRVEVCNAKYGRNGWLGIASVWASGSHITQGTVKMNDTYFATAAYNTVPWKNLVLCQELGHTLGLDHQDETFENANLGTCMDYTNDPLPNQHPNAHDYGMLEELYAHLDATTTVDQSASASNAADIDMNDPSSWGKEIAASKDGRASLFVRNDGKGAQVFTHVFWADGHGEHDHE